MILSGDNKETNKNIRTESTIKMKLEQDTATKANIWWRLRRRWNTRQMVRDKSWMIHKGEQAKEPEGKPIIGDKLIGRGTRWETHGEGHMMRDKWKHRKDIRRAGHHYRQRGRQMKGDMWRDTSKLPSTTSQRRSQMTGNKIKQVKRDTWRAGHHQAHWEKNRRQTKRQKRDIRRAWQH